MSLWLFHIHIWVDHRTYNSLCCLGDITNMSHSPAIQMCELDIDVLLILFQELRQVIFEQTDVTLKNKFKAGQKGTPQKTLL